MRKRFEIPAGVERYFVSVLRPALRRINESGGDDDDDDDDGEDEEDEDGILSKYIYRV
jgi:hypothetical protein